MERFELDSRLEKDSRPMVIIGLCQLRLMRDARWPWLLLVPQRPRMTEVFDLTPLDQTMLTFEIGLVGKALKQATGCTKVNLGALGNQVRQLHLHVIARSEGDPAWPGPVWGVGQAKPYAEADENALIAAVLDAL